MNKIFIWWYCEKDNTREMLNLAKFNLIEAKSEEEAIETIDKHIETYKHDSYACLYKKGKISIGMMETEYIQTSLLEWDKPITNDN